jgi:hypothetical protein
VHPNPRLTAITATIVFVGTLGLLLVVFGFGVIRVGDEMLEGLGMLSPRWGENNLRALVGIAGIISAPVVIWLGVWFFRRALAGERRMEAYEAAPKA